MPNRDTALPGRPSVRPGLFYKDMEAAYDYLVRVFGFEAGERIIEPAREALIHADIWVGDQCVMLFEVADWNPLATSPAFMEGRMNQMVHVDVPDLDAAYAHIVAHGGEPMSEPFEMFYGDRMFSVADLEGHIWAFHSTNFTPKPSEEWGAFRRVD